MIPACLTLSNIRYVSRVKWSTPAKGVAPFPTPLPRCSNYWKGSLLVAVNYGCQLYLPDSSVCYGWVCVYIYIYIYIYIMGVLGHSFFFMAKFHDELLDNTLNIYIYIYIYIRHKWNMILEIRPVQSHLNLKVDIKFNSSYNKWNCKFPLWYTHKLTQFFSFFFTKIFAFYKHHEVT